MTIPAILYSNDSKWKFDLALYRRPIMVIKAACLALNRVNGVVGSEHYVFKLSAAGEFETASRKLH